MTRSHNAVVSTTVDDCILELYRQAGKIASDARDWAAERVAPGVRLRDIQEGVEQRIRDAGALPSFPAQTSRNEIAAHYCSSPTDNTEFETGDLVKIDVGAHIDGYPVDTGVSVDLSDDGRWDAMIETAGAALDAAISTVADGVAVGDVGVAIGDAIESRGFTPIYNLAGHSLERWSLHAGLQIPNSAQKGGPKLSQGMIFAIEPFVTTGRGYVEDKGTPEVFMKFGDPSPSNKISLTTLAAIDAWHGLPVARRYFRSEPRKPMQAAIKELVRQGVLREYPPLVEATGAPVAWKEHTIYLGPDGAEVVTA